MKKRIIILTTLIIVSFGSCTNLDDEIIDGLPTSKFPENNSQIAAIPIPAYKALQSLTDWAGWWFAQELTGDGVVAPTRGEHWDDGGKWRALHTHTWTNNTEAINSMWDHFYRGVFASNKALDLLATFEQTDALKIVQAKLLVMRAFYYYLLIDNYGDVPYITSSISAPEFPKKEKRATIFASIVKDIEDAVVLIPEGGRNTSASQGMAYTLLAKLFLNAEVYTGTAQWAKAEEYCDKVIALGYVLESDALGPFVTNNENSLENIFTIPYDKENFTGFNLHMRTLHYNSNLTFNMVAGPWNGFAVTESHYNTYEDIDARKKGFLVGQQYDFSGKAINDGTTQQPLVFTVNIPALQMGDGNSEAEKLMSGARVVKFEIENGAKDNLSNDFPLFRFADVLLMKSEAAVRQGKSGDEWINLVRTRAGVPNFTNVTLDQILAERGREMFWEAHRRQDLIRFGKFNNAWWEKPASSPDRNLFPIPQWAIDANPNLN